MITDQNAADYGWADAKIALRARWPLAVLIASVIFLLGGWLTVRKPAVYESVLEVLVDREPHNSPVFRYSTEVRPSSLNPVRIAENRLESGALLLKVADSCHLASRWGVKNRADVLRLLRGQIDYRTNEADRIIEIRVRDVSPAHSSDLANTIGQTLRESFRSDARNAYEETVQSLDAELRFRREEKKKIEKRLLELSRSGENRTRTVAGEVNDLRNQLVEKTHLERSLEAKHQLAVTAVQNTTAGFSILNNPTEEDAVLLTTRKWRLLFYAACGVLIGATTVFLLSVGKSPVEIVSHLTKELNLDLIGYVPVGFASPPESEREEYIEAYRDLRSRIFRLPARESAALLFLPRGEDSGFAEVAANTARTIAATGQTALVIDGDFRNPKQHELFDAARHPGVADFLSGEMRLEETVVKTRFENLWLMPAGPLPHDPSGLVTGKRMDDLIWEMKSRFDYILITAPSIHQYSDAAALSPLVDHVLAVTAYHTHSTKDLGETKKAVEACHSTLSGVVLTRMERDETRNIPDNEGPVNGKDPDSHERGKTSPRPAFVSRPEKFRVS